jgi:hypothetical protein
MTDGDIVNAEAGQGHRQIGLTLDSAGAYPHITRAWDGSLRTVTAPPCESLIGILGKLTTARKPPPRPPRRVERGR